MRIDPYLGGFYGDAFPTGERAVLMPFEKVVRTHLGDLTPQVGQLPLYTCVTRVPTFQVAGQANEVPGTSHYYDDAWHLDPRIAHGNFGCIFDRDGVLRIIEPAANQTSQGYRYVAPDGRLVLGDETLLRDEVSAYTDLSEAQDRAFLVGQNHSGREGVVVKFEDGVRRMLHAGTCAAVRAHQVGEDVTICFYEVEHDGLTAFIYDATVAELRALPPADAVVLPPKIEVIGYGPVIKAGQPWQLDFADARDDTRYRILLNPLTKTTSDLRIRAGNASGSDATGLERIVTIEGADIVPPEEPIPSPTATRFRLAPNIASQDMLTLLSAPTLNVDLVQLYVQNVLFDGANQGPNTKEALLAADVYRKLGNVAIEMGSVKGGNCEALNSIHDLEEAVRIVTEHGGCVWEVSQDEPLTAWKDSCFLRTPEQIADAVAAFMRRARELGVAKVGWIEAWPHVSFTEQQTHVGLLAARGQLPDHWHLDVDWNTAAAQHLNAEDFLRDAQRLATEYGIELGVIINATVDPMATDAGHHANLMALATRVRRVLPDVAHVTVQSWAFRVAGVLQDVPNNLGPNGLVDTFTQVRTLFEVAPPQPEENDMLSVYTDPLKEVIAVKEVKPIAGGDLSTWVLPNGLVYSCQPGGLYGERPAGTEGPWERNRTVGNLGTFFVDGKYYTKCFVLVGGLS